MIEVSNIGKQVVTSEGTLRILEGINLSLDKGETLAIIGPSGSGKSTLLGILAGLDMPTSGTVCIDGEDITAMDEEGRAAVRAGHVGFVFQFYNLMPSLTARENVELVTEIASDPMGPNVADSYVKLKPRDTWRREGGSPINKARLVELMSELLERTVPGQTTMFSQPIQLRFNEIMAGSRADLSLKIFGDDLDTLRTVAETLRGRLAAHHQLHEFGPFKRQALFKGQAGRGFYASQIGIGRIKALPLARIGGFELFDHSHIALDRPVARWARALGNHLTRKGNGVVGKRRLPRQCVNKAQFFRLGRGQGVA